MNKQVLGIDHGSKFSSVSITNLQESKIVSDKMSNSYSASIINFSEKNINAICGNFVNKKLLDDPLMTIYDVKRILGKRYDDPFIQKMKDIWPFKIESSQTGGILICIDKLEKKYQPYEIVGELFKYLSYVGNSALPPNQQIKDFVIAVSVTFNDEQRTETLKAAQYAGFNVIKLINEPTAAYIAIKQNEQQSAPKESLVIDFGAGFLDVSLMQISGDQITVIDTDGDGYLGGNDFDENTLEFILNELKLDKNFRDNFQKIQNLRDSIVDSKIALSSIDSSTISSIDGDFEDFELSCAKFEEINAELINRFLQPIQRIVDRNLKQSKLDEIILVGGSSKMKFVKNKLLEFFKDTPISFADNDVVAIGAGISASESNKLNYKEICSNNFVIQLFGNDTSVVFQKGTPIPANKVLNFQTILYRQTLFDLTINEKNINDSCLIGFEFSNIPQSEDYVELNVTFSLDENGILSASAQCIDDQNNIIPIVVTKRNSPANNDSADSFSEHKLFFKNIQRFISSNMINLLNVYPQQQIDRFMEKAKFYENEENLEDLDVIRREYITLFRHYFRNHPLPGFLKFI